MNPLNNVPLNTKRQFVMGKTSSGCEVYMPVDSNDIDVLRGKKHQLQYYLNKQPKEPSLAA